MDQAHTPSTPVTVAVPPEHAFDEAALDGYLRLRIDGYAGRLAVRKFDTGTSNPTYLLTADQEGGGQRDYVLRKQPAGKLLPSAHLVDREFRVIQALEGTGVPLPKALVLCEDRAVLGQMFYVMEHVPGRILEPRAMDGMTPAERGATFDSMNAALAALHTVDYAAVGLGDFGKPGGYVTRQIALWTRQYLASRTTPVPEIEKLIDWLPAHLPDQDETVIAHGDFRLGNLIIHPHEPRISAVLDWELCTLGHPLADLSYCCLGWRTTATKAGFSDLDIAALGIPTEQAFVAAYFARTGRDGIADWPYYIAFSAFRLAAIAVGLHRRALDGNASNAVAATGLDRAQKLSAFAWNLVR